MPKKQSALDKLLGRNKPESEPEPIEFVPEQEKPKVEEFMEIGGSPVPGITLHHILRGHEGVIGRIAWSPDGRYLASPASDANIYIWEAESGNKVAKLKGDNDTWAVAWSIDSDRLAIGMTHRVAIWDAKTWKLSNSKDIDQEGSFISASPNGKFLAVGNGRLLNWRLLEVKDVSTRERGRVTLAWSSDSRYLAIPESKGVLIVDTTNWTHTSVEFPEEIFGLSWTPDQPIMAIGGSRGLIHIWDKNIVLEGHTENIHCLSFSHDSALLASSSLDNTVRIWRTDTWKPIAIFAETSARYWPRTGIAFHPFLSQLATLGNKDSIIRIWDIDYDLLISKTILTDSIPYTTAKLVLVGDSGVGKTGLGWRLAHNEFKEHSSTHGQQFWVVPELKRTREDGTECEAVLWDLAGQHIYRSIHSIFLDDVDASLVLFDPTNRQEPLKGAQFWLEQLKGKKQLPPSVLVGARLDRGAPILSQQELDQFCQKYGISGGYVGTSAKTGEGVKNLVETLQKQIPWDQMTTTVTTITFKKIKDYVLVLKEKPDRKGVLVRPDELRNQLQATDKDWEFSDAEMITAVGHLANHGYVTILHSSVGEKHILLVPEILAIVASSIVFLANKNSRELGAVSETDLLQGSLEFEELVGLDKSEQQILVDAAIYRFLDHNICFREQSTNDVFLIFPSLIKQKRPLQEDFQSVDDVSYIVRGRVENIYAALVVLLGYTSTFNRRNQWQSQAQYEMGQGEICGFRLTEEREGELELVLYYGTTMPTYGKTLFQGLFESFIYKRDVEITRFPPVHCVNGHLIERTLVIRRVRDQKGFIFCDECGERTTLPEIEKPETLGKRASANVEVTQAIANLRSLYEKHLTNIKSFRRDRAAPRCYVSYTEDQSKWAEILIHDLKDAGVIIIEDESNLEESDFVVQVCTPQYKQAWGINTDLDGNTIKTYLGHEHVIPLLRVGNRYDSVPRDCIDCRGADFREDTYYSVNLFDLVLSLYAIPLNHPSFEGSRKALLRQWKETLEGRHQTRQQLFISYAWGEERETIVNELDQAFQERGITIVRDKRDLGFKGDINDFMKSIGEGKAVILVISEKYLKSPNCCFELVEIAKYGDFVDRIFPIVLDDAKIYDPVDRARYVEYWENKKDELDAVMKRVSSANLQGFREEIDLYEEIRALLPNLMNVIKRMNTLTPDLHRKSEFSEIFDAVMAKLEE